MTPSSIRKGVKKMRYSQPEVVLLGSATGMIQGKMDPFEVDPPTDHTFASAYDLDE